VLKLLEIGLSPATRRPSWSSMLSLDPVRERHRLHRILHCGLVRVAKKNYRKCSRKNCPFANAPQKRHGGQAQGRFFSKCHAPPPQKIRKTRNAGTNFSAIGSHHTALRSKWTEGAPEGCALNEKY
jgi:hypothetical protein